MVMELLEGRDLSQYLADRGGSLPAAEAVALVLPLLAGLDCAHRKKILHRDIKPENVFLTVSEDGVVPKLVDFGIALANDVPKDLRATRVGSLLGTPLYMAPEQVRGSLEVDERTDLWAVCTVLYEAIAGRAPFQSDNLQSLFFAITCHPLPTLPSDICDDDLAAILSRGLEKDPARRFASARELGAALAAWGRARGLTSDSMGQPLDAPWLRASSSSYPSLLVQSRPPVHSLAALARTESLAKRKSRWVSSALGLALLALGYAGLTWAHQDPNDGGDAAAHASLEADGSTAREERPEATSPAPRPEPATPSPATPLTSHKAPKVERPHRHVDPNWGF
jgi:serine/threonine-protein kinase